jgi:hypothetical protein
MLARISPQDTAFVKCQVEIHNIVEATSNTYAHVRQMVDSFGESELRIKKLGSMGGVARNAYLPLFLWSTWSIVQEEGVGETQFTKRLLPYLLELRDNLTKA